MDTAKTLKSRRFFSWFDVDALIRQARAANLWPDWVGNIAAYIDSLVVTVRPGTKRKSINELLSSWLGARFDPQSLTILLESLPDSPRKLVIEIEELDGTAPTRLSVEPTFKKISLIPENIEQMDLPPALPVGTPPLVAFYSFKGGVGRTTHLLACLKSLSMLRIKTLVVDADLEAPGITALVNADKILPASPFSFVDLLALAQSDVSPNWSDSLKLASFEIRRNIVPVSAEGTDSEHYFLPAYRDLQQTLHLDIRPEHLINVAGSEWDVGNLLGALGRTLAVDAILIDLRAGLSELASPFLLDPRMRRVIISTPSLQSVEGTVLILKELSKIAPQAWGAPNSLSNRIDLFDPIVLLTFVTQEFSNSGGVSEITQRLLGEYPDAPEDWPIPRLAVRESSFSSELLVLSSFQDAMRKLDGTNLQRVMSNLAEEMSLWPTTNTSAIPEKYPQEKIDELRNSLADAARRMEYAESGKVDSFLSISPLRLLAQHFRSTVPVAVVIGAKGSGKTFTYMQLVRSREWSRFVSAALRDDKGQSLAADIWPLLQSKNLDVDARGLVNASRKHTASDLQFPAADISVLNTEDAIRESLTHEHADLTWWRNRWFKLIADSFGINSAAENMAAGLVIQFLRNQNMQVVVVIDGLEDLFGELQETEPQKIALRALLQEVPAYLREIPNSPLGIVIFIRADLVSTAISQNEGQFRRLYEPYALRWNEEEALRLAAWLSTVAGADLDLPKDKKLEAISSEEAKRALVPIWGWKLGTERSREARTAEWVIAALSDFRGQVQARDLVRLFRYAAEKSKSNPSDRVLIPRAIRDAIQPCSEEKIKEIEQEIPPLKDIFAKLQNATERKIPFAAGSSGLSIQEIRFLEATGVLIEDRSEYFMPEIFRLGLRFQLAQGARPRVLSLARRAVGKQLPQQILNL